MIKERIKKLQELMKSNNIDNYIIPTSDFHQSEYVGNYFLAREYMSGFTGSAGTLIVTLKDSYLWVDGRYHIQAESELEGTGIILMKMGMEDVESIEEFLDKRKDESIGFDGRVMATSFVEKLKNKVIISNLDLVGMIWDDRPSLQTSPIYDYSTKYCGTSRKDKLNILRSKLGDFNHHIITSLDDIAYILNLRGSDVACNPVFNSYALINKDDAILYVGKDTIDPSLQDKLAKDNIYLHGYEDIYEEVKVLFGSVVLDKNTVNYKIVSNINPSAKIVDMTNPSQLMKAIKNDVEINNTKKAHLLDGIAETKFMYYLKNKIKKEELNEISISNILEDYRKLHKEYKEPSFDTICAANKNGALMHYTATNNHNSKIDSGLLLIDSGGQYFEGTTDITRTFVIDQASKEMKKDFTIALKALLGLQNTVFLKGILPSSLDIKARGEVFNYGLDYRCATGHGVGHYLNVHEGPNIMRPIYKGNSKEIPLLEGMITTDEPGIYKEGKYGIRHENELLCIQKEKNEYGTYLAFEPITYVPFDTDGIDKELLTDEEIKEFNEYQEYVFDKISKYLSDEEIKWYKGLYI
ncbi:MAG: aminopeptidase P family N-terminal domain-containing protein [Thomasclavelia sp.]|nr:aminopeptidase P family N-terminal domain-containing protein [Thomasclavelia sp.]